MRYPFLLLLTLFVTAPARAVDLSCLFAFGELTEGPQADEAMRATYRDLWQVVGLRHAKPAVLKRLAEGDDPYLEKAELPSDLQAMRQHLAEFRQMLARKGWDNEATRALLLTELRSFDSGTAEAAAKQHKANERVKVNVYAARWGMPAFSADGKWLVSHGDATNHLWLTNLQTGTTTDLVAPYEFPRHENPGMTSDGKYVVTSRLQPYHEELRFFPVDNGKVDMATSFTIDFPKPSLYAKKVRGVKDTVTVSVPLYTRAPNLMVAGLSLSPVPYVFDVAKRTAGPLKMNSLTGFTGSLFSGRRVDMGNVGGTGELFWMNATKRGHVTLYRGTVDKDGLSKVVSVGKWQGYPATEHYRGAETTWSQDGKVAVARLNSVLYLTDGKGSASEISLAALPLVHWQEHPTFATPTPDGKKVAVILSTLQSLFGRLLWYEVATKEWSADVRTVPLYTWEQRFKTSPDGTKLFFRGNGVDETKSMALELE